MSPCTFPRVLLSLAVLPALLVAFSGCGHRDRTDTRTLAQISGEFPDSGFYLCRQDFKYAYDERGNMTQEFLVEAGDSRKAQKRAIVKDCTTKTDVRARKACATTESVKAIACAHESVIAPPLALKPGSTPSCTLTYSPSFDGQPLTEIQGQLVSDSAAGTDLLQHTRSVITQCLALSGAELDGCSDALLKGQLTCENR